MKLIDMLQELLDKLLHHSHKLQDGNAAALIAQMKEKAGHLSHLTVTTKDVDDEEATKETKSEEQSSVEETVDEQKEEQGSSPQSSGTTGQKKPKIIT